MDKHLPLKLFYCNANGLFNKIDELKNCTELYGADIVCINETHFNKSILDAEIAIPGFQKPFRKDRDFCIDHKKGSSGISDGGGSIIYVKDTLKCAPIDWFNVATLQLKLLPILVLLILPVFTVLLV